MLDEIHAILDALKLRHARAAAAEAIRAIYELAELDFIDRGQSLVFIGEPAVGKSGLAAGISRPAAPLETGRRAPCPAQRAAPGTRTAPRPPPT